MYKKEFARTNYFKKFDRTNNTRRGQKSDRINQKANVKRVETPMRGSVGILNLNKEFDPPLVPNSINHSNVIADI
jgi:hypothetical protein